MNKLIKNEAVEIGGHKFECPIKYIEHEIAHPADHHYVDIARLTKILPTLKLHMEKLEHQQKEKQLDHSIGGPSL